MIFSLIVLKTSVTLLFADSNPELIFSLMESTFSATLLLMVFQASCTLLLRASSLALALALACSQPSVIRCATFDIASPILVLMVSKVLLIQSAAACTPSAHAVTIAITVSIAVTMAVTVLVTVTASTPMTVPSIGMTADASGIITSFMNGVSTSLSQVNASESVVIAPDMVSLSSTAWKLAQPSWKSDMNSSTYGQTTVWSCPNVSCAEPMKSKKRLAASSMYGARLRAKGTNCSVMPLMSPAMRSEPMASSTTSQNLPMRFWTFSSAVPMPPVAARACSSKLPRSLPEMSNSA